MWLESVLALIIKMVDPLILNELLILLWDFEDSAFLLFNILYSYLDWLFFWKCSTPLAWNLKKGGVLLRLKFLFTVWIWEEAGNKLLKSLIIDQLYLSKYSYPQQNQSDSFSIISLIDFCYFSYFICIYSSFTGTNAFFFWVRKNLAAIFLHIMFYHYVSVCFLPNRKMSMSLL